MNTYSDYKGDVPVMITDYSWYSAGYPYFNYNYIKVFASSQYIKI